MESYGFCLDRHGEKEVESNQYPVQLPFKENKRECLKKCKEKGEIETVYGCVFKKDGSINGHICNYYTSKVYVGRDRWNTTAPICWIFGKVN